MSRTRQSHSKRWLNQHLSDPYVKQAQTQGLRSRAAYKLLECQEKYRFIKPGMTVVDLGAAPGSWSQVAAKAVGDKGKVIAVDLLPMDDIAQVTFKQGDFTQPEVLQWINQQLDPSEQPAIEKMVDVVLSDMAPNLSGVRVADQARAMGLAEHVSWFALENLRPGGALFVKVFQGPGIDDYVRQLKQAFDKVLLRKPKASRAQSREFYLLALSRKSTILNE